MVMSSRTFCTLFVFCVLAASVPSFAEDAAKGHLLIIGGGDRPASIMGTFARLAGGSSGRVLVFPQASELPDAGARIKAELEQLGLGRVDVMAVDRAGADTDGAIAQTQGATGVYFGGGDQARLMDVLAGTRLERRLHELYRHGAVMAGTSAGAAVMSRVMITGDEKRPLSKDDNWQTIEADNVVTRPGLGFLGEVVVDQHFVRRKRHNRLISLVLEHPALLGLALDEATAVLVKPDRTFEVIGEGPVLVLDAAGGKVARDPAGGLRGSGLSLHVLRSGSTFDLASRRVGGLAP
jgi:cyanophycinase